MKSLICLISLFLTSTVVLAVPGGSHLVCQSSTTSASKQKLQLEIGRMNGPGTSAPEIKISVNGNNYPISTPDVKKQYGQTIHDAALGVIVVTANNFGAAKRNQLSAQVMAVPGSVKAFDQQGHAVAWTLQDDDGGECIDGNGQATFQGVFTGTLDTDTSAPDGSVQIDNQLMDCVLTYDTGSAC